MGASLGWALKKDCAAKKVSVWSRSEASRNVCKNSAWCDAVFENPQDAVKDADLVVISTVATYIPSVLKDAKNALKKGAIVTDVGSVKAAIVSDCEAILEGTGAFFVGSHPMAGLEKSGAQAATPELFKTAMCFVCKSQKTSRPSLEKVVQFWENLGMRVGVKSPEEHDKIVARVSHLPQCVSSALALLAGENIDDFKNCAGNGFRDTTRIAKSDVSMWQAILKLNAQNISENLSQYISTLQNLKSAIDKDDTDFIAKFLTQARETRQKLDK